MTMGPVGRRLMLTLHVVGSVGWLGGVVTSLALATAGVLSADPAVARAMYPALEVVGWTVLAPGSLASLATGLVQGLGTAWGVLRHYWVLFKLVITVVASAVLLLYLRTLDMMADAAAAGAAVPGAVSPVIHAAGAVLMLLAAVVLSIYKPRGLTPYGQRDRPAGRA